MSRLGSQARSCWLVVGLLYLGGASGCIEWLEVESPVESADGGAASAPAISEGFPVTLPNVPPRASAAGPLVPQTPGLRVPDGYWTRVRIDQADVLFPHTWAVLQPVGYAEDDNPRGMTLRLQAQMGDAATKRSPSLRGVVRIAVPPKTSPEQLVGLSFGEDALVHSTVSVRISKGTLWTVVLERLSIQAMDEHSMVLALEGQARAGKRAKRSRRFTAAVVALRAKPIEAERGASAGAKP